jgi:hypothetical protein
MPKPVLSDSLFNADDVATAVLAEANLQVTNNELGVSDGSSLISFASGWQLGNSNYPNQLYTFNGFGFISLYCNHSGGTPSSTDLIATISNSDYFPSVRTIMPTISYQADSATMVEIHTNGDILCISPNNLGLSTFYVTINGFYKIS